MRVAFKIVLGRCYSITRRLRMDGWMDGRYGVKIEESCLYSVT
jgi:hypothetical protein